MTVQGESAAPPPTARPEARCSLLTFILPKNTSAGGSVVVHAYNAGIGA